MHPLMIKNFGNWAYHDRPRPGVLHHVAKNGDEIWTVRVGTQRQLGPYEINLLCDIIDQFGRFPHRNKLLGRENTPEENEYLSGDVPDFGQGI